MPIIVFGFNDQVVSKALAASGTAGLYTEGLRRRFYTHTRFAKWMVEATLLAALVAYLPLWFRLEHHRSDADYVALSFTAMVLVCFCTNLRLAAELHSWGFLEWFSMGSMLTNIELCALLWSYVSAEGMPSSLSWYAHALSLDNTARCPCSAPRTRAAPPPQVRLPGHRGAALPDALVLADRAARAGNPHDPPSALTLCCVARGES